MLKSYLENIKKDIKSGKIDTNKILWMAIGTSYPDEEECKVEVEFLSFLDRLLTEETKKEIKIFFYNFYIIFENSLYTEVEDIDTPEAEAQNSNDIDTWIQQSYTTIKNYLINIIEAKIKEEEGKQEYEERQKEEAEKVAETFFNKY